MRFISCILLFAVAAMASRDGKPYYDIGHALALFEKFMKDYNRHYKSEADKVRHYEAFVKTLDVINKANAEQPMATFDINNFADYTPEEMNNIHGFVFPGKKHWSR